MPLPALAIPIISALGQGLSGYLQNKAQNQQQQLTREQFGLQKQALGYSRGQQLRDNAMQDAQGHALNPIRSNLYASLAQRLGLPAGTFAFSGGTPQQNAPHAGPVNYDGQAKNEQDYQAMIDQANQQNSSEGGWVGDQRRAMANKIRAQAAARYPGMASQYGSLG